MKWSVVGLMVFGIVAAISATVLVASLRADKVRTESATLEGQEKAARIQKFADALASFSLLSGQQLPAYANQAPNTENKKEDFNTAHFCPPPSSK